MDLSDPMLFISSRCTGITVGGPSKGGGNEGVSCQSEIPLQRPVHSVNLLPSLTASGTCLQYTHTKVFGLVHIFTIVEKGKDEGLS